MNGAGRRSKGASGEREAAKAIMANTCLKAERNARNGKATSDVVVWRPDGTRQHLVEVKRVESLDIGTKQMQGYREQAEKDGAIGILWRRNREAWRLEAATVPRRPDGDVLWAGACWATFSGDDVWRVLEALV